jgi:chromosome segregation ATPase
MHVFTHISQADVAPAACSLCSIHLPPSSVTSDHSQVLPCHALIDHTVQDAKDFLKKARLQKDSAVSALSAAKEGLKKAESTALSMPLLLLELDAQITDLTKSSIPQLQESLVGLKRNVSATELTAKLAMAGVHAAERMVVLADEKAAQAEKAWQAAEDKVDELLDQHNNLLTQIAAMAEYFRSHSQLSTVNAANPTKAAADEQARIKSSLEALGKALVEADAKVFNIQGQKQDVAAVLAEQKVLAAQEAAKAAAAESEFRLEAANLAAAKASVTSLQQQLQKANASYADASANLAKQQGALEAAVTELRGEQVALQDATAAVNATRAAHQQATAELSAAVAASLHAQNVLTAAMASLQNAKANETNAMTDYFAAKELKAKLEGQLASATAAVSSSKVTFQR